MRSRAMIRFLFFPVASHLDKSVSHAAATYFRGDKVEQKKSDIGGGQGPRYSIRRESRSPLRCLRLWKMQHVAAHLDAGRIECI
jgi:hypothetical protein